MLPRIGEMQTGESVSETETADEFFEKPRKANRCTVHCVLASVEGWGRVLWDICATRLKENAVYRALFWLAVLRMTAVRIFGKRYQQVKYHVQVISMLSTM